MGDVTQVRLTPDGRVVARILHGTAEPWVAVHGGADGLVLEVETYSDAATHRWRRFKVEPNALSGWMRRRVSRETTQWRT